MENKSVLDREDIKLYSRVIDTYGQRNIDATEISILIQLSGISSEGQFEITEGLMDTVILKSINLIETSTGSVNDRERFTTVESYKRMIQNRNYVKYSSIERNYKINKSATELGEAFYNIHNGSTKIYNPDSINGILERIFNVLIKWKDKLSASELKINSDQSTKILEELLIDKKTLNEFNYIRYQLQTLFEELNETIDELHSSISKFQSTYIELTNAHKFELIENQYLSELNDQIEIYKKSLEFFESKNIEFNNAITQNKGRLKAINQLSYEIQNIVKQIRKDITKGKLSNMIKQLSITNNQVYLFGRKLNSTFNSIILRRIPVLKNLINHFGDFISTGPLRGNLYAFWKYFLNDPINGNFEVIDEIIQSSKQFEIRVPFNSLYQIPKEDISLINILDLDEVDDTRELKRKVKEYEEFRTKQLKKIQKEAKLKKKQEKLVENIFKDFMEKETPFDPFNVIEANLQDIDDELLTQKSILSVIGRLFDKLKDQAVFSDNFLIDEISNEISINGKSIGLTIRNKKIMKVIINE